MIRNTTGAIGEIDIDKFQRAIIQYRNCLDQDTKTLSYNDQLWAYNEGLHPDPDRKIHLDGNLREP